MKTISIFIIIVICILALQFCLEGFLFFGEQARAEEEICRAKESVVRTTNRADYPAKALSEQFFHKLLTHSLEYYCSIFSPTTAENFSIVLAKRFNHSPPALIP